MNEDLLPKELTSNVARRGKWTVEEEKYTEQIIDDFDEGVLDVPEGTTLRTYLSRVLNCDPMRITKKYTGNLCIGKRTFTQKVLSDGDSKYLSLCHQRLNDLRFAWVNKLLLTEQWNNRKLNNFRHAAMKAPFNGNHFSAPSYDTENKQLAADDSEAQNIDLSGTAVEFDEEKVRFALLPFFPDDEEVNQITEGLKTSHTTLEHCQASDSAQILDELSLINAMPASSLYKILLSGCVGDHRMLQSAVQAIMERLILRSDAANHNRVSSSSSSDRISSYPTAGSQRVFSELGAGADGAHSPKRFKPAAASADQTSSPPQPQAAAVVSSSGVVVTGQAGSKLSLEDCLRSLQKQHHRTTSGKTQILQGPISASAAQFMEQQSARQLQSSVSSESHKHTPDGSTSHSSVSSLQDVVQIPSVSSSLPIPPLPNFGLLGAPLAGNDSSGSRAVGELSQVLNPVVLQSKLQASLGESFRHIASKIAAQQQSAEKVAESESDSIFSSNRHKATVESAAEALLGLIQN